MKCVILLKCIFFSVPVLDMLIGYTTGADEKQFKSIQNWPIYNNFGQISSVGVDKTGKVYVFHRGNRIWDASTFSLSNIYINKNQGPIPNETIIILDPNNGSLIKKTGANIFYLPHGLTIDDDNNIWLTDVALHQVFKFPPIDFNNINKGLENAKITLGVPFEPGSDQMHFCKPTSVAVDTKTKEFYVSDGYCNARLIKYDQYGNILLIIGRSSIGYPEFDYYMLNVPHALALAEDKQILFVADRENLRVVSYDFKSGKFKKSYGEELKGRIFSIAYSQFQDGLLFVLINDIIVPKMVAVYNIESGKIIFSFSPKENFTNPHDLAISSDGIYCYVVELNPYKIWKFKLDNGLISKLSLNSYNNNSMNEKESKILPEPVSAESKINERSNLEASSSFLIAALIVSVVVISFLIFMFHYYKSKGGYRRYETRRLILDDDEGGIRLT